jgi:glycerate dehydrogenase
MGERIVVLDGKTLNPGDNPWTPLEELGDVALFDDTEPGDVVSRLDKANITVVNKVRLSAQMLNELPELRFITVTATGFDCVDVTAARKKEIPVSNVPTYGTDSVAQYAFALMLELSHRIGLHDQAVRDGEWESCGSFSFWKTPQVELSGRTLGIIGFGRIGRRVGEIGNALGMRILACDQFQQNAPTYEPFAWATAEEVASESDVVTLHCNLTDESGEMINRDFMGRMKPTAFLINCARGQLVDEVALADALNANALAGAALDVVSTEPIRPDNPMLSAKNCLLTPHIAWSTLAARQRMMSTTARNIRAFLSGSPVNVVNG